jgi:TatD DNase family protein
MSSIIDTHCHLDLEMFDDDREEVLREALAANVHAMLLIGYNPERWRTTLEMCEYWPFLRRATGIHPNDASLWCDDIESQLRDEITKTFAIAIGEIGLDYYRNADNASQQRVAFERQLDLACSWDLPVIIHQRAAENDVLEILTRYAPLRGVMHCFTGTTVFAERCLELGMYLGIGGVVTYPRSTELRDAVAAAPIERLLIETDAPFLAPQLCRGKRNEPALLPEVARAIANIKQMDSDALAAQTSINAINLFGASLADALRSGMEYS